MKEQTEIGKIKEGRYIVIDEEPCKVVGIATSKPGKHGAAKARIDAVGIFDGVKRSIVSPVSAKTYVPVVERKSGQVLSIAGNMAQLMDMKDFSNFEIIPSRKTKRVLSKWEKNTCISNPWAKRNSINSLHPAFFLSPYIAHFPAQRGELIVR